MLSKEDRRIKRISHYVLMFLSLCALFPFALLIVSSLTDDATIIRNGYSLFPEMWSLDGYRYLFDQGNQILHAYGVTIFVTVVGTIVGVTITTLFAYAISRPDFMFRRPLSLMVVFSILFNGGMVPTYLIYTKYFGMKNSIWGLIIPLLLVKGFDILIMRNYFILNIPKDYIEAAKIDGAGEFTIFMKIVLPLSKPIIATIGLLTAISYWNDWFNSMLFITKDNLFSVQAILNRINTEIAFLSNSSAMGNVAASATALPAATVRMAIAVVAVLPILLAYPFFQRYFIKGLTIGGIKG